MFGNATALSQATTIASGTAETTIVTADPNFRRNLVGLIITTPNAAIATLTLRDATGGTVIAILDYPNAASAPGTPLAVTFDPPLQQTAKNSNWTLQASVAAAAIHIVASFVTGN
jgi:hypothetical protein